MPKKTIDKNDKIQEKLDYLQLDLDNIPEKLKDFGSLQFRVPKFYEEKQYKQYRYIPINDIQILLSPTNRLDELEEKYKKASPLVEYLDSQTEDNIIKYTTFLNMLKQVKIEDIEKIAEEQENLNKKLPFKVKFEGNYLWQIYYSESTDKYFMLVPTEDSDYSTFFYLIKKQIENKKTGKIFVPIRNEQYSNKYLKKSEFEDIANYLWLFTKDWPLVYEVYDKSNRLNIQIVGETEVYGKIKSPYKIKLSNKNEANQFYKLLKAMFILQTELPQYFNFETNIDKTGKIDFSFENEKIEYEELAEWITEQYLNVIDKQKVAKKLIKENEAKLQTLKSEAASQEIEYLAKEKQISTFLECKKTFFGKFKYYFKYNKKTNKNKVKQSKEDKKIKVEAQEKENNKTRTKQKTGKTTEKKTKKENYTIEELIEKYKEYEVLETKLKNILMDINALKLKNKNMAKKIENATLFINEIDSHKRSIFEFWKYSNKDEVATLAEGEKEEVNIIKKITKAFDYEEDLEDFGKMMDKIERKSLSKEELDSVYITTTNLIEILNQIKTKTATPKEIEASLKDIKKEAKEEKTLSEGEEFDIFGGIVQDSTKVSKIANKKHREQKRDKFSILEVSRNTKQIGYKLTLEQIAEKIDTALTKVVATEDLPIYKAMAEDKLDVKNINVFNINPLNEIQRAVSEDKNKINFYKINLTRGQNAISYTNIIFYDNQNKTLPVGQDLSTRILVDVSKMNLDLKEKKVFKIAKMEDEKDDFSKVVIKTVTVFEYDLKED